MQHIIIGALFLIAFIISLGIMFRPVSAQTVTCDQTDHIYRLEQYDSTGLTYSQKICQDNILDSLMFVEWRDGLTETVRPATVNEQTFWQADKALTEQISAKESAETSLAAEFAPGKKVVRWLRNYAKEHRDTVAVWDSLTDIQKNVRLKTKWEKDAKMIDGLADLLITLGYSE